MSEFMRFYRWGMVMKQSMALYALGLIFTKGVVNLLLGVYSVDSFTMLQMVVASFLWAVLESAIFPQNRALEREELRRRTSLWAISGNVLLIGGAFVFGWFAGIPVWGGILLLVVLEGGMFAMWVGLHVALKKDSNALNRNLRQFQSGQ